MRFAKRTVSASAILLPTAETEVSRETVKLCALCDTLNYFSNAECWTCRWHGAWTQEPATIALAWERLEAQYEEVRLEHVTSHKMRALGDFGVPAPRSFWQVWGQRWRSWRQRLDARRVERTRSRETSRSFSHKP